MNREQSSITIALVTTEYVTEENFDGGLSNYMHRVALCLKQLGHNPIVIVTSKKNEIIYHKGIEVHRVKLRGWKLMRLINLLLLDKLSSITYLLWLSFYLNSFVIKKINQNQKISIVHYPSCAGLGLFRLKNIPSIIRISSYIPLWNKAYELKPTLNVKLSEKIEDIAYIKADALIAPSYLNAKAVEQVVGKDVAVIETPFILETTDLDYSVYEEKLKNKKYLLFFGTIGIMKGCGLIAEIIQPLLQKYPDLHFVFVGKDKGYLGFKGESVMDRIKRKAAQFQDRVIHCEPLTHNYLYPIVANAYAVVLPSRVDNFPNTCIEAMAHKRIVIGTQGTSFEQLIQDGISGFLCQKDNASDLLNTIETVLQLNPQEKTIIEEQAFQRIQRLSPEIVVNELVDFYKQVIEEFNHKLITH